MNTFELIPGTSWTADRAKGGASHVVGPPDLERTLDAVDLFLGGTNVAARTGQDAVFCIARDLLAAVRDLALHRVRKATVSFYEGPWELVLLREGRDLLVSFLRVGAVAEVVVLDARVSLQGVGAASVAAGARLLRCARRLDPGLVAQPIAEQMDVLCAEVRGALLAEPSAAVDEPARPVTVRSRFFEDPPARRHLALGFELTATSTNLLGPAQAGRADLHALLALGTLVAHAGGERIVVGEGRVFLQVERLLAALHHLLDSWERGRPLHIRLIGDTLQAGVRLTREERVTLSLGVAGVSGSSVAIRDLSVGDVARAVLALGTELGKTIKQVAPGQRHNPRFESFRRELSFTESWYRDLNRPSLIDEDATPIHVGELQEAPAELQVKVPLTRAQRLSFTERWWLEAEGLDLDGTFLCGDRVVATAHDTVMALDRDRGELLWRIDARPAYSVMAGHHGLVRLEPSGSVSMIDIRDGRVRWETALRPRAGTPMGTLVGGTSGPRCVVLAESERSLVALDLNTGHQRWRFGAWRGREFGLRPAGRLLLVTCGDSAVYALDVSSGRLVWRHTARATFEMPAIAHRDRALACGGPPGGRDARLFCTDLASGRLHWVRVLDLGVIGPPVGGRGDVVVIPCRHVSGSSVLVGLDIVTGEDAWRRWLEGWGPYTLLPVDDDVVACGAGGMVSAIDVRTGGVRWSHSLDAGDPDDVPRRLEPVLRGGALFVPADTVYVINPRDGSVIHRLGGDTLIPDLLRVDEQCGLYVAEEAGYLAAYGVAARLAIVR
jgi:outer membrane protein assembly factor BamB